MMSRSPLPRALATALLAGCAIASTMPAHADAVTDWNAIADGAVGGSPPPRNRILAMVQVAVHDALNTIHPRYETYTGIALAMPGASMDAAVATAAYRVLSRTLTPAQAAALLPTYTAKIDAAPDCPAMVPTCIEDGIAAGLAAADAIVEMREGDGSATPNLPYTLAPAPGVYQPTPPAYAAPNFAGWARMEPFVMRSGDQFRMDSSEIFDLTSAAYTRDCNEVKRVGGATSEALGLRTPDQSAIARYWPGGGVNGNAIARTVVAGRGLDPWEHARLFALMTMAISDSAIAAFDTKNTYNFWRPVTAIRAADTDGNPATEADPAWLAYQGTPPYPDYTCGLTNNSGSELEVLRLYLGTDDVPYTLQAAGITRSYATLSQAGDESVDARVFGGMHFRTGCVLGLRQGEQVGRFAYHHYLRPLVPRGKPFDR